MSNLSLNFMLPGFRTLLTTNTAPKTRKPLQSIKSQGFIAPGSSGGSVARHAASRVQEGMLYY